MDQCLHVCDGGFCLPRVADKSGLAQMKARRRSTIGVRGSPETNSLIRFMAQNRMKTPPSSQSPEVRRLWVSPEETLLVQRT